MKTEYRNHGRYDKTKAGNSHKDEYLPHMSLKDKSSRIVEDAPEGAGVERHQDPQTKVSGIKSTKAESRKYSRTRQ